MPTVYAVLYNIRIFVNNKYDPIRLSPLVNVCNLTDGCISIIMLLGMEDETLTQPLSEPSMFKKRKFGIKTISLGMSNMSSHEGHIIIKKAFVP